MSLFCYQCHGLFNVVNHSMSSINPQQAVGYPVADPTHENGFYFDPNTIIVAEITAEAYQTSICQISSRLGVYDGGTWYIPYMPIAVEEL